MFSATQQQYWSNDSACDELERRNYPPIGSVETVYRVAVRTRLRT